MTRPLMIARLVPIPLALALALALTGCYHRDARHVESGGPRTIVSVGEIDIQDWNRAANEMVESMLASDAFQRESAPAVLAMSRIVNNTTRRVDIDLLTRKIRVQLNQSDVARTTTVGGLGEAEDPLAKQIREQEGKKKPRPDFTLSGKISQVRADADRTFRADVKQTTYVFQLSLTDVDSGLAVWEDERQITKQGSRDKVGW